MANDYSASTIESLDYFEHIRRYPGMYIGSKDEKGLLHCVKEILSNSIDEYLNGAGTCIYTEMKKDGSIYIQDDGRGIPHGTHDSGCSLLQACYGIANTGGKFNNATGESGYNTSGGEHGTGGKAVNALSTKMIVTTAREGIIETVEFSKGKFVSYNKGKSDKTGVTVQFYPDGSIFETTKFDPQKIQTMIQEFSFLCSGLRFVFVEEGKEPVEYFSKNGLQDYIEYLNQGKDFLFPPIYLQGADGSFQVEAIIGYNSSYSGVTKLYTNNIPQEKGTHLTGFKTAWTSCLNTWAKDNDILKEKDSNFTGSDLEEGQMLILNFKMIDPVFKGQNKEELSSSEGRTYVQRIITQELKFYLDGHKKDIKILLDKALNARKAREAARKARDAARKKEQEKKEKVLKFASKLSDAHSKDRKKCELYITEGDSATGGIQMARNNEFQAVLPVRGKILNCQKATIAQIQKNAEIMTMIDAFGLSIDPKTMKMVYDKDDLRYGKIIIMSDADQDGSHIKNLFYTFIWAFCPQLILDGYVFAGVPPLYKITFGGNKGYKYLKNDAALEEFRKANATKKYEVGRLKGLGEMSTEEVEETLMNVNERIIKQVTVSDVQAANTLFNDLMGTNVQSRKDYIKLHSSEAKGMV